uniref:ASCH domain-containing protein n=1 Tax=Nocardioides salarius TaxID=374513 RepID=UPI0030FA509C
FHAKLNTAPSYFGPTTLEVVPPPAWSFGATAEEAEALLALVLDGTKTATASAHADYEVEGEPLPEAGTLGIVLDGEGHPRALVETTDVRVVPFDEVSAEHAHLEGEGDRSLEHWRAEHERFFAEHATAGFDPSMLLVLERFRVVYAGD